MDATLDSLRANLGWNGVASNRRMRDAVDVCSRGRIALSFNRNFKRREAWENWQ